MRLKEKEKTEEYNYMSSVASPSLFTSKYPWDFPIHKIESVPLRLLRRAMVVCKIRFLDVHSIIITFQSCHSALKNALSHLNSSSANDFHIAQMSVNTS